MVNQYTDDDRLRTERIQVNVTAEEYHRIKMGAYQESRPMSAFIRSAVRVYLEELDRRTVRLSPTTSLHQPEDDSK